jgi:hypothetical protein
MRQIYIKAPEKESGCVDNKEVYVSISKIRNKKFCRR